MKNLLLMRHAKSSWKNPDIRDHDRPLNKRGKRASARMARLIVDEALCPDCILSSTARRAADTAAAVSETCPRAELLLLDALYLAAPDDYLNAVVELATDADCIMLVGHNPSMEMLAQQLGSEPERFPTACLAQFEFDASDWETALTRSGRLVNIWYPRDLEAAD